MRNRFSTLSLAGLSLALALATFAFHKNASAASADPSSPMPTATPPLVMAKAGPPSYYTAYGFRIQALEAPLDGVTAPVQALVMQLPLEGGFRASVNVQLQATTDTLQKYMDTSRAQMTDLKMKIISEKTPTPNDWIIEYTGQVPVQNNGQTTNTDWHFVAHIFMANKIIYQATGACLEQAWAANSDKITSCVNSLQPAPAGK